MMQRICHLGRVGLWVLVSCAVTFAQAPKSQPPKNAAPATYVTPGEMTTAFNGAPNQKAPLIDMPVRVIESDNHYLGVALVRRTSADQNALVHDKIDEVYYILEGGGTLTTGGGLVEPKYSPKSASIGPGWSGKSIADGQTRRVNPGDVVFITAGTPHMFTKLDGTIRYLVYRVDTSKVIALK